MYNLKEWGATLPRECQKCGRGALCGPQYYGRGIYGHNAHLEKPPLILVVPNTHPDAAKAGQGPLWGRSHDMIRACLATLQDQPAFIVPLTLCPGDKQDRKHAKYCWTAMLEGWFAQQQARGAVAITFGDMARDFMTGLSIPPRSAVKYPLQSVPLGPEGRAMQVLLCPDLEDQQKGRDIRPYILDQIATAQQLLNGTYVPFKLPPYEIVGRGLSQGAIKGKIWDYKSWAEKQERVMALDIEFNTRITSVSAEEETYFMENTGELLTIQVCGYNPQTYQYSGWVFDVRDWDWELLREFCSSSFLSKTLVGSFFKIDLNGLWVATAEYETEGPWEGSLKNGIEVSCYQHGHRGGWHDGHYVRYLEDQSKGGTGLKPRTIAEFGWPDWSVPTSIGFAEQRARKEIPRFGNLPDQVLYAYGFTDAYAELKMWREVHAKSPVVRTESYREIRETSESYMRLERLGIRVDTEKLKALQEAKLSEIAALQAWLDQHPWTVEALKGPLNVNSEKDMGTIARYCRVESLLPKTDTGKPSTSEEGLAELTFENPQDRDPNDPMQQYWGVIWDLRKARGIITNKIVPFLRTANRGWCHPIYSLSKQEEQSGKNRGVLTSRGSASLPNVMAMLKDRAYGECFPAPPGYVIVEFDYKTGEPVINGYLSKCRKLMEIFELGAREPDNPKADVYRAYVAAWSGIPEELQTKEQRNTGKVPWLSASYGKFPETIAEEQEISVEAATLLLKGFYAQYPEILQREHDRWEKLFRGELFVNPMGRRRTFPLFRKYPYDRRQHGHLCSFELAKELRMSGADAEAMRQCGNDPIQCALGVIMFYFLNHLFNLLDVGNSRKVLGDSRPFRTVHDSVALYIREDSELLGKITYISEAMKKFWNYVPKEIRQNLNLPDEIPVLQNDWKLGYDLGNLVGPNDWEWQ